MDTDTLFLQFSRDKLIGQFWPRLRQCVESLTIEQVWWRPNEHSNSVGNLLLHLNGNVRQWLVTSFDADVDARERSAEFNERQLRPVGELLQQLAETMRRADAVLARLTANDLRAPRTIQGYSVSGLGAVYHVVEHFGMHYGQILYVTKWLRDADLGFYKELDGTGRKISTDVQAP